MGKGTIISGGTDGQYQVSVVYNTDRQDTEKAANIAKIADIDTQIAAEEDTQKLNVLKLQKLSLEKRNETLDTIPESEDISAWCADLTEDLSWEVGLIEVPGESVAFNIQPGYDGNAAYDSTRDGQLFPTMGLTPASAFYNLAMLPGWQKWKPTYRYATITAITGDIASISMESAVSTQQGLDVNQETTLSDVAIEYMNCNGSAFKVGDDVLVQFTGQNWSSPKIIGFKDNPAACGGFMIKITLGSEIIIYDVENDQIATGIPKDDGTGNAVFPCASTGVIDNWLSEKENIGHVAVTTQSNKSKYTPTIASEFPPYTEETLISPCYHTICDLEDSGGNPGYVQWTYDYYRYTRWAPFDWIESEEKRDSVLYVELQGETTIVLKSQSRASSETKYRRIDRTETNDQIRAQYSNCITDEYKGCSIYVTPPDPTVTPTMEYQLENIEIVYDVYNPFVSGTTKTEIVVNTENKVHFEQSNCITPPVPTTFCEMYQNEHHLSAPFRYASVMGKESEEIKNPYMVALTIERFIDQEKYRECGQSLIANLGMPDEWRECPDLDSCTNVWGYSETEAKPTVCNAFIGTSVTDYGEDLNPFEDLTQSSELSAALELFSDLTATNLAVTFIE